jgi:hypothetical protein
LIDTSISELKTKPTQTIDEMTINNDNKLTTTNRDETCNDDDFEVLDPDLPDEICDQGSQFFLNLKKLLDT